MDAHAEEARDRVVVVALQAMADDRRGGVVERGVDRCDHGG